MAESERQVYRQQYGQKRSASSSTLKAEAIILATHHNRPGGGEKRPLQRLSIFFPLLLLSSFLGDLRLAMLLAPNARRTLLPVYEARFAGAGTALLQSRLRLLLQSRLRLLLPLLPLPLPP